MKITEKTVLKDILDLPRAEEVLHEYELPCLTCPLSLMEMEFLNLGEVAGAYDLDLEGMLADLNRLV